MRTNICCKVLRGILFGSLLTACIASHASPLVVPAGDDNLRSDLEWLSDRGIIDLSTSTWPLSVTAIQEALDHVTKVPLAAADQAALDRVQAKLARLNNPMPQMQFGFKSNSSQLPHGFADQPIGNQEASIYSTWANSWVGGQLQVNALRSTPYSSSTDANLDGSYIGTEFWGQLLYFGRVDRFWGPGETGSLGLGNAARPLTALTLQRASAAAPESPWLHWLGPWTYQVFDGKEEDYTAVPNTQVFGARLTIKPFDAVEMGLYRTWQWAGDGRPDGWSAWWNDFRGNSNIGSGVTDANKPGAQQAGGDIRWNTSLFGMPWSVYGQFNGSDGGGHGSFHAPSRNAVLVGSSLKTLLGDNAVTWRFEAADTKASRYFGLGGNGVAGSMYTAVVWSDGYYQQGLPLGYPIGGDGKLFSASVNVARIDGIRYGVNLMHMSVNEENSDINAVYPIRDNINILALNASYPAFFGDVRATVAAQHSQVHKFDAAAMVMLDIDLEKIARFIRN